jgi:MFS family permease
MVHAGKDAIKEHLWRCTNASDTICTSVFEKLDPTDRFCQLHRSQWEWTHPQESVRSELGFFCDRAWILQITNAVFFLGFLCGAVVAGWLSDKYGRKRSMTAAIALSAFATALPALASSGFLFAIFRFFQGMSSNHLSFVAFPACAEVQV